MSSKYKVADNTIPHFVTFTVVGWIDVFSREQYKEIIVESLQYCMDHKGLFFAATFPPTSKQPSHNEPRAELWTLCIPEQNEILFLIK